MSDDKRAKTIAGLRELASWLEAHPEMPLPSIHHMNAFPQNANYGRASTAEAVAELRRLAALIGAEVAQAGPHIEALTPRFGDAFSYAIVVCNAKLDDFPTDAAAEHICSACGRSHAAEDLTRGVGEVAAPAEGSGAATAPADESAPASGLEEVAGPRSAKDDGPATEPADETVWTAGKRKGINYHAIDAGNLRSVCGRSILYGVELPRRRAAEFATPCPRCYPDGAR